MGGTKYVHATEIIYLLLSRILPSWAITPKYISSREGFLTCLNLVIRGRPYKYCTIVGKKCSIPYLVHNINHVVRKSKTSYHCRDDGRSKYPRRKPCCPCSQYQSRNKDDAHGKRPSIDRPTRTGLASILSQHPNTGVGMPTSSLPTRRLCPIPQCHQ